MVIVANGEDCEVMTVIVKILRQSEKMRLLDQALRNSNKARHMKGMQVKGGRRAINHTLIHIGKKRGGMQEKMCCIQAKQLSLKGQFHLKY